MSLIQTRAVVDDRRSYRTEVGIAGHLVAGTVRHAIVILNISAHGVMAQGNIRCVPGRPVVVEGEGMMPTRGRVAWTRAGHIGIAFTEPLSLPALIAVM